MQQNFQIVNICSLSGKKDGKVQKGKRSDSCVKV